MCLFSDSGLRVRVRVDIWRAACHHRKLGLHQSQTLTTTDIWADTLHNLGNRSSEAPLHRKINFPRDHARPKRYNLQHRTYTVSLEFYRNRIQPWIRAVSAKLATNVKKRINYEEDIVMNACKILSLWRIDETQLSFTPRRPWAVYVDLSRNSVRKWRRPSAASWETWYIGWRIKMSTDFVPNKIKVNGKSVTKNTFRNYEQFLLNRQIGWSHSCLSSFLKGWSSVPKCCMFHLYQLRQQIF